jgi:hypothetical protein
VTYDVRVINIDSIVSEPRRPATSRTVDYAMGDGS